MRTRAAARPSPSVEPVIRTRGIHDPFTRRQRSAGEHLAQGGCCQSGSWLSAGVLVLSAMAARRAVACAGVVPARSLAEQSVFGEFRFRRVVDVFEYVAAFETTDGVFTCPRVTAALGRLQAGGAVPPPATPSGPAGPSGLAAIARARGATLQMRRGLVRQAA